ncbi:MAG: DUF1540 domain-containing protein [bacterium]|nr:DUF1540 domain-containing protein [bacterium]
MNTDKKEYRVISGIKCEVENCKYNSDGCHCIAGSIEVGPSHAASSEETVCDTFIPR